MRASAGHISATLITTTTAPIPPPTTDAIGPNIAAVAPLSKAPNSLEKPTKT